MGHSTGAYGALTATNASGSAGITVGDFQAGYDRTEYIGGVLKITAAERISLLTSQVRPGWLISETDTGRLYVSTVSTPQGELIHTPETTASVAWAGIYSSAAASPVVARSKNDRVSLEGIAVSSSAVFEAGPTYTLGSLPAGYRPGKEEVFAVPAYSTVLARLLVQPGGALLFQVSQNFTAPLAMGLAAVNFRKAS